jgi:archaellum component FlaC
MKPPVSPTPGAFQNGEKALNDMTTELTKEMEKDLGVKFLNTPGTAPKVASAIKTVTNDIEALKSKLDTIAKGINLLRDQL